MDSWGSVAKASRTNCVAKHCVTKSAAVRVDLVEETGELLTAGTAGVTVIGDGGEGIVAVLAREEGGELTGAIATKEDGN